MNDHDRLAADLDSAWDEWAQDDCEDALIVPFHSFAADRLIALGWTRLDEERLARAFAANGDRPVHELDRMNAAAIAKAYREDTDA